MRESSPLLVSILSDFGHSLKNIETVLGESTDTLLESEDKNLKIIGHDSKLSMKKLSSISDLLVHIEDGEAELNPIVLAFRSVLEYTLRDKYDMSSQMKVQTSSGSSIEFKIGCSAKILSELLNTSHADTPPISMKLVKFFYLLLIEEGHLILLNGKQLT